MEKNGDLRRDNVSGFGGLSRRRQRTSTLRDSAEENKHVELLQTMRFRDREVLQKKDRDRDQELPKRRRIDRQQRTGGVGGNSENYRKSESSDSSDEEYYGEEEEGSKIREPSRMNQPPPPPSSSLLSNQRRNLRSLRSSPVFRATDDEIIGVPVPRRARSASAKRLHEYRSSGCGRFGEALNDQRFSPSPANLNFNSLDSPSSSGASMNKKMKSVEPGTRTVNGTSNSRRCSIIQDDIEFEVAEALFDLMKQSKSSNSVSRDGKNTADDELKRSKAEGGGAENSACSVQKQQSMKVDAETVKVDSIEELKKDGRIEKEKTAQESRSGGVFVNKGKVASPRENKSPSRVKVNTRKFPDPTVTKVDYEAVLVGNKKEVKLDINLMAPLTLLPPSRRDVLVDIASTPKVMIEHAVERSEAISKYGPLTIPSQLHEKKQLPNLDFEKQGDSVCVTDGSERNHGLKEHKNQLSPTLQPFPITMSGWPGVVPHPGYMPPLQVIPVDESARSTAAVQPPKFKFSEPRPKKCATHQYLAHNIQHHHQLVKKSLCSGPEKSLYPTSVSPTQKFVLENPFLGDFQGGQYLGRVSAESGKAKSSKVAEKRIPQQVHQQAPANPNLLHGPGFIFPFGHHQTMAVATSAVGDTSRPAQSASAVGDASLPSNSAGGPSSEASPYMAMLQKNGYPFPISTNIGMPPQRGGSQAPTTPMFTSPFYSSPIFNVSQNQLQQLSVPHSLLQSASQSTSNGSPAHKSVPNQKQPSAKTSQTNSQQPAKQLPQSHSLIPNSGQTSSFPVIPMNFAMIPPGMMCGVVGSNKHSDPQQKGGSKDRGELTPQGIAYSFGSNASTNPALNFSSSSGIFSLPPEKVQNCYQMAKQKNFQESEEKSDNGLKGTLRKSESGGGQTVDFSKSGFGDVSAGSTVGTFIYDGSSALTGKQTFPSLSAGLSITVPNFQQYHQQHQQFIQLQKHHMQQMQLTGTAQGKTSASVNIIPGSLVNFPVNNLIYAQNGVREDKSTCSPQWENLPRTVAPEVSSQNAMSKILQQQPKTSPGQMHISFGNISDQTSQGPQFGSSSNSSTSKNTVGSLRNASALGKGGSVISTQQADAACRGNVPSILSTCTGQLSELKY